MRNLVITILSDSKVLQKDLEFFQPFLFLRVLLVRVAVLNRALIGNYCENAIPAHPFLHP